MRPENPNSLLKQAETEAFLISNVTNIQYITGFSCTFGILLVKPRGFHLYLDGRYTEAAKAVKKQYLHVHSVNDLAKALKAIPKCGFESEFVTVDRLRKWKKEFSHTTFIEKSGVVAEFRRTKNPDEIRLLKKARSITQEMLSRVPALLKGKVKESDVALQLYVWARELGAQGLSFEPIVAFGKNSSKPHHRASDQVLRPGDIVQIDVGAKYKGYCADMSRVFFTKKPTPEQLKVYDAVRNALEISMEAACAGISVRDLDTLARGVLKDAGCDSQYPHALGHGVGLDVHEDPRISYLAPEDTLRAHEVLAIEPAVYIPGKFGIREEDMAFIEE